MGGGVSKKVNILPTNTIVKRIDECIMPDEREAILDYVEMFDMKLENKKTFFIVSKEFHEAQGVPVFLKIAKGLFTDSGAIKLILQVLENQISNISLMSDFIQFGGLDLLIKVIHEHERDEMIQISIPNFMKKVVAIGADAAIKEITEEGTNLILCVHCQEVVERAKKAGTGQNVTLPRSADRVNRVLMFMENYAEKKEVQICGLNAMMRFANNPDAKGQVNDTKLVYLTFKSIEKFKSDPEIVWRAMLVLATVASFDAEASLEMVDYDIHKLAVELFQLFKQDFRVQQQMLWLLGNLLKWPRSRRRVQCSEECMNLFKDLTVMREELIISKAMSATEKFKPYEIVLPLKIREFLRISKGVVIVEAEPEKRKKHIKNGETSLKNENLEILISD